MIVRLLVIALSLGALSAGAETQRPDAVATPESDNQLSSIAYKKGHDDAERDLKAGHVAVEIFGLPAPYFGEYTKLLLERYHIELRQVAGCLIDEQIAGHAKGYNEVAMKEIERHYGKDILETARQEASKHYADSLPK
jgi:hypothetical protein